MGCSPFANYHFQMGFTAMGFAEDFGLCLLAAKIASPKFRWFESQLQQTLSTYTCNTWTLEMSA